MKKYILGISCYYHDSSAALMKDGIIVAGAEEERFTRRKHDNSFPINAIKYCLKNQCITIDEVGYIGFYEKPFVKFERILYQHLQSFPKSLKIFLGSTPSWINEKLRMVRKIKKTLKYNRDILFIEHHMAHAASTFLVSPFKKAAILTVDGVGEWTTTAYGYGEGNKITLDKEIRFPDSLGLLYSSITAYLGFSVNNSEYKVMGLSSYGDMNPKTNTIYKKMRSVIEIKPDGSYKLDLKYFKYHFSDKMPSKELCRLLGGPIRKPDDELTERHKEIAAALQLVYEEVLFRMLTHVHKVTKNKNIVLAGGCALNSVANGKILSNTPFKKIWIQPNSSDGGTSMGAAAYVHYTILGNKRKYVLEDAYLGPGFSKKQVKDFLEENKIKFREIKEENKIVDTVANLVFKNYVVGWFNGRMEWGPRALGARSILANPLNPDAQELLNLKVKHREEFRPFAPVVCEDDVQKFFDCDKPLPAPSDYMLMVYPIKKKWHKKISSVTHVDGSGRVQTIRRAQNPKYYDLLKRFGELSGIPILINTSFNIRGEPIVCTPYDAYKCMMGTGIDYIMMENFLIKRDDNPKHMWDSEKYAND